MAKTRFLLVPPQVTLILFEHWAPNSSERGIILPRGNPAYPGAIQSRYPISRLCVNSAISRSLKFATELNGKSVSLLSAGLSRWGALL